MSLVTSFSITPYQAFWHRKWLCGFFFLFDSNDFYVLTCVCIYLSIQPTLRAPAQDPIYSCKSVRLEFHWPRKAAATTASAAAGGGGGGAQASVMETIHSSISDDDEEEEEEGGRDEEDQEEDDEDEGGGRGMNGDDGQGDVYWQSDDYPVQSIMEVGFCGREEGMTRRGRFCSGTLWWLWTRRKGD